MRTFESKVVIVTGAASGIGRSTALAFAKEGAKVVVSDISVEESLKTVQMIKDINGEGFFIKCNVANEEDVENLVNQTIQKFGRIDCAFNNAGIEGQPMPTTECSLENWNQTIDINLKGVWLCMKYEILSMLASGSGRIVNCSSVAGLMGFANLPAYVASKHGVIGLTRTAAIEYANKNIRVNAVCPGAIHTPMLERFTKNQEETMASLNPMGRIGRPEEIAEAVVWLCSEKSSYVNGQALAIDGGWVGH